MPTIGAGLVAGRISTLSRTFPERPTGSQRSTTPPFVALVNSHVPCVPFTDWLAETICCDPIAASSGHLREQPKNQKERHTMRCSTAFACVLAIFIPVGVALAQGEQASPGGAEMPPASGARPGGSPPGTAPKASPQVLSYALGFNIGGNLRSNQLNPDLQSFMAGIEDGLKAAEPRFPKQQLIAALEQLQQQARQRAMAEIAQTAETNKRAGAAFLARNRQREGVQVTPSGLQYIVLRQGDGPSPNLNDTVRCHYRGTLADGTEFDSSYGGKPLEFPVNQVIPGWTEALQKMRVGDKWQLFIPGELAYGMNPPGPPLEPNSLLIFEVELLGIDGQ